MKRYDLELTATGPVMEERKEGAYVTFSEVEQLQAKVYALLEERNSTGIAISNAILVGVVPDKHPLRSRLELLANHRKMLIEKSELCDDLLDLIERMVNCMGLAGEEPEKDSCNPIKAWMYDAISTMAGQRPKQSVAVTETIRTAPERIWLQVGDQSHYHSEPFPSDTSEVSWCADSVIACEVPYVRADLACQAPLRSSDQRLLDWAVTSWHEQVAHRPMENVYRRTLDSVWRQVIRFAGEDPHYIIGTSHDDLLYPEQVQEGGEPCASEPPSSSPA